MIDSRNECDKLLTAAQFALEKTKGQPEDDLRDARNNATVIDRQNKRNKELLDYIHKYDRSYYRKIIFIQVILSDLLNIYILQFILFMPAPVYLPIKYIYLIYENCRTLTNIPSQSSSVAPDAMKQAMDVERNIKIAIEDMNGIVDRIPEDLRETKQLSKNSSESIRDISQANKQLDIVDKVVPNITSLLNSLNDNQRSIDSTGNDLQSKIEALKNKIANARELADRFRTGLTFYRNTTLELKNPESLPLLATSTKISLYFRTNKTNGFLLYLGNEEKIKLPRSKTVSSMKSIE